MTHTTVLTPTLTGAAPSGRARADVDGRAKTEPAGRAHTETPRRYSLALSNDPKAVESAQRLRHDVFLAEPGFSDTIGVDGLDADSFDEFCDHLLVRDEVSGQTIGCYRMLPPSSAAAAGGLYTATEFALEGFADLLPQTVEMGRACVHPDHRSGAVLSLMWTGIMRYLQLTGCQWVLGCVSVPLQDGPDAVPGANVRGVRDLMLTTNRAPQPMLATPRNPVFLGGRTLDEIEPPAQVTVPPLLKGYLRLGAKICGEPAMDLDFGCADFVAVLGLGRANGRYLDRLGSMAQAVDMSVDLRPVGRR
jgi:putative hemolysin